jgi:hypothetical protein
MADMAQFVHKFRANGDAFPNNSPSKVIKRNRQPLSCLPCRQRKLKCSRQQPCETCVKRNDESSCTYAKPVQKGENKTDVSRAKAQDRLRQLEDLVMQMVETAPADSNAVPSVPTPVSNISDDGTPRDGVFVQSADSSRYVGSTHWSAILENIQDLKATLKEDFGSPKASLMNDADEAELEGDTIFGAQRAIPMQQILEQYLPPRLQIDRLLSVYFNAKYMVIPYIHTYQFQRQYEEFWRDPLAVSPHWMSVLFSICCMASKLATAGRNGAPSPPDVGTNPTDLFINAAAQCLMLGGFKPRPFVIEALALYAQCKYSQSMDPSREVGLIFSILVRLAYRMAYHRDPDNFPHFSPFEGEMRRRVWAMTRQFDLMTSFQLGLPPNVAQDSWDTKVPRNLLDSDFDENVRALPQSRPEHEPTQILYFIIKSRLMSNFAKICTHALSFKNSSQFEIAELDRDVRETFNGVPDTLRVRPMSQSFADPPYLIMVRLNCEFLYQKSLLVLHRKYMTQGFDFSTKACMAAATAIVRCFIDIHKEFKPGGQLYQDRWMLGSFTMNDYLLACMILCLAISQWRKNHPGQSLQDDEAGSELLQSLRMNYCICAEEANLSMEARRVAEALRAMLKQVCPHEQLPPIAQPVSSTIDATFPSHRDPTETGADQTSRGNNNSNSLNFFLAPLSLTDSSASSYQSLPTTTTDSLDLSMTNADTTTASLSNDSILSFSQPTNTTSTPNPFDPFFLDDAADVSQIDWPTLDAYLNNGDRFAPAQNSSGHIQLQPQPQPPSHLEQQPQQNGDIIPGAPAPPTTGSASSSDALMPGRLYPATGTQFSPAARGIQSQSRSPSAAGHRAAANGTTTAGEGGANGTSVAAVGEGEGDWESAPMHFLGQEDREGLRFPL